MSRSWLVSFLWISLLIGCGSTEQLSEPKFYSSDSLPATISFATKFQLALSELPEPVTLDSQGAVVLSEENQKKVDEVMHLHILHLYGVFTYHEKPVDFSSYSGTIQEAYKDYGSKITQVEKAADQLVVHYDYKDRGVFYSDLFWDGGDLTLSFYMPKEPTTVYKFGFPAVPVLDPVTKEPLNTCSDTHDNSEAAFWYYWSPQREGCPAAFVDQLQLVEAHFKVLPVTESSWPEYDQLYQQKDMRINILIGADAKMDDPRDLGRLGWEDLRRDFERLTLANGTPTLQPIELAPGVFEKYGFTYKTDQFDAQIAVHFVNPDDEENWDEYAAEMLATSDVMIFSGHSYEDWYLDPDRLFADSQWQMPGDRYQIQFFNACTSWSYFNSNYFDLKKQINQTAGRGSADPAGTKYLDILTNAIGAPFTVDPTTGEDPRLSPDFLLTTNLLGINEKGRRMAKLPSWQTILNRITTSAGYDYTALTNVIGDEDNPTRLPAGVKVPKPIR